ncbi:MAG TPA: tripartite tricarboxylate transporter substrate binding protein [Casimicrobiaceae bacterium]|nr:tripartite tricarboxylate transporter substrate binding protein [Casimicrobiaceae bacterium]
MWTAAIARIAVVVAAIVSQGTALAQVGSFPDRPIKFIVPYGPGGTVDPTARTLAARAAEILGQPVVVENKPGAAGSIGTDFVVRAPADGYSVLIHTNVVASEPWLKPTLTYNFLKDMTPLVTIDETPFVVLVNPALPVNSVKELVEYAKQRPGQLNYGASGIASSGHLRGEQFQLETGTKLVFVPYVDGGATLRGLLSNEIQVAFDTLPGSIGMIQGGKLRLLAVGSSERWFLVPETPTTKESGLGALVPQWIGAYVRADTPPAIIAKLARALKDATDDPKVREQYRKLGFETVGAGPQETAKRLREETEMWRKTIEAAGIKAG